MGLVRGSDQKLKYNTKDLLDILKKNKAEHDKEYRLAKKTYDQVRKEADTFEKKLKKENPGVFFAIELNEPRSYLKSYDQIIRMLELCVDETIELDGQTFSQYVMDEWDWSDRFRGETVTYANVTRNKR